MKALQWDGNVLQINNVTRPERAAGEALLKVSCSGICNTDLEILRGYHDFHGTLGHEFVGVIEDSDDLSTIGRRVVCDINCACNSCDICKAGNPHHCPGRVTLGINGKDGVFAEYINVPQRNLFPIPESLTDQRAVFAEPVAAALEILEQVGFRPEEEVAVIGDGKLGLLITMCLVNNGQDVSLVGHHPEKLSLLEGFPVRFYDTQPDRKYPVVIEATGNISGFESALSLTAPGGTMVLKSTFAEGFRFNPAPIVVDEITLIGSRCGPMGMAVALLDSGKIKPERLIEKTFFLADSVAAIDHAGRKGVLKVLIEN